MDIMPETTEEHQEIDSDAQNLDWDWDISYDPAMLAPRRNSSINSVLYTRVKNEGSPSESSVEENDSEEMIPTFDEESWWFSDAYAPDSKYDEWYLSSGDWASRLRRSRRYRRTVLKNSDELPRPLIRDHCGDDDEDDFTDATYIGSSSGSLTPIESVSSSNDSFQSCFPSDYEMGDPNNNNLPQAAAAAAFDGQVEAQVENSIARLLYHQTTHERVEYFYDGDRTEERSEDEWKYMSRRTGSDFGTESEMPDQSVKPEMATTSSDTQSNSSYKTAVSHISLTQNFGNVSWAGLADIISTCVASQNLTDAIAVASAAETEIAVQEISCDTSESEVNDALEPSQSASESEPKETTQEAVSDIRPKKVESTLEKKSSLGFRSVASKLGIGMPCSSSAPATRKQTPYLQLAWMDPEFEEYMHAPLAVSDVEYIRKSLSSFATNSGTITNAETSESFPQRQIVEPEQQQLNNDEPVSEIEQIEEQVNLKPRKPTVAQTLSDTCSSPSASKSRSTSKIESVEILYQPTAFKKVDSRNSFVEIDQILPLESLKIPDGPPETLNILKNVQSQVFEAATDSIIPEPMFSAQKKSTPKLAKPVTCIPMPKAPVTKLPTFKRSAHRVVTKIPKPRPRRIPVLKHQAVKPSTLKPQAVKLQTVKPQAVKPQAVKLQAVKPQTVKLQTVKFQAAQVPLPINASVVAEVPVLKPPESVHLSKPLQSMIPVFKPRGTANKPTAQSPTFKTGSIEPKSHQPVLDPAPAAMTPKTVTNRIKTSGIPVFKPRSPAMTPPPLRLPSSNIPEITLSQRIAANFQHPPNSSSFDGRNVNAVETQKAVKEAPGKDSTSCDSPKKNSDPQAKRANRFGFSGLK